MGIMEIARGIEEEIIAIRRKIHENPELSLFEFETAKLVAEYLGNLGMEVHTEVGGTGVVGLLKGKQPGRTVGLRADMDALPIEEQSGLAFSSKKKQVMHACGHDMHTAVLLGAANVLSGMRDQIQGNVKFIFQPAEEKALGAANMMKEGALENPRVDFMFCLHTWPKLPEGIIGVRKGPMCASADEIEIEIEGKGGHAAHPDMCIDPLPIAANIISTIQTIVSREIPPTESAVVTIGAIHGGSVSNVIPSSVKMRGTVRTINPEIRAKMPDILERIITNSAAAMRGKAKLTYHLGSPPLVNDDGLVELGSQAIIEEMGPNALRELKEPSLGGEDFSFYLEKVPGMMFRLGTRDEREESALPLHHPGVVFSEKAIVPGITALATVALQCLKGRR